MAALEEESTQKKGMILLMYNFGGSPIISQLGPTDLQRLAKRFSNSTPTKFVAIHYCSSIPNSIDTFVSLTQLIIGREGRIRFRTHFGTFRYTRE